MGKHQGLGFVALAGAVALMCTSCGSGVGNAGPRVGAIPSQQVNGGETLSLDLADYVSDRENDPLTYAVVSGGGSIAGSVYTHMFDTVGGYTVEFDVSDGDKVTRGTIDVVVLSANLAVVTSGDDLLLVDTDTQAQVSVSSTLGVPDRLVATTDAGLVVYERDAGTTRLVAFDLQTRATHVISDSATHDATYVGHSDDVVLFERSPASDPSDTDLLLWRIDTAQVTEIAAAVGSPEGNPMFASDGRIFYEAGAPSDILIYDPDTRTSSGLATAATAEALSGVLAGDVVVFSRVGGGGERDLYHYSTAAGIVEIGADLGATVQAQSKALAGALSTGEIVFQVTAATQDLYVWDPALGQSTAVGVSTTADEVALQVTVTDELVFSLVENASPANTDLYAYRHGQSPAVRTVSSDAADDAYQAQLSTGDVVFLRGSDVLLFDTSAGGVATLSSAGPFTFHQVLSDDNLLLQAGADLHLVTPAGASTVFANSQLGGATSGGSFVFSAPTGLELWDATGPSQVTVTTDPADTFGAGTAAGDVLFERTATGKTTTDLFLWVRSSGSIVQLTDGTADHDVIGEFSAGM